MKMFKLFEIKVTFFILGCLITSNALFNQCEIQIQLLPKHHAIFKENREKFIFLRPKFSENVINVPLGSTFRYICNEPEQDILISCNKIKNIQTFVHNRKVFNVYDTCNDVGKHVDITGNEYKFGFKTKNGFFEMYKVVNNSGNFYTKHELSNTLGDLANSPRGDFGTLGMNISRKILKDVYKRTNQLIQINSILGLKSYSDKYIKIIGNYYIAKGHLVPFKDFTYPIQQELTLQYLNVAPQWQTCNAGNWKTLELSVRKYVTERNSTYTVYTGTAGIMELKNQKIYLIKNFLYVPALFWKIIVDKEKGDVHAFVVINNPHLKINNSLVSKLKSNAKNCEIYLNWRPTDQKLGFAFCLSIEKFLNLFPDVLPQELIHK